MSDETTTEFPSDPNDLLVNADAIAGVPDPVVPTPDGVDPNLALPVAPEVEQTPIVPLDMVGPQNTPAAPAAGEIDPPETVPVDLTTLTHAELVAEAKRRGVSGAGSKAVLLERLTDETPADDVDGEPVVPARHGGFSYAGLWQDPMAPSEESKTLHTTTNSRSGVIVPPDHAERSETLPRPGTETTIDPAVAQAAADAAKARKEQPRKPRAQQRADAAKGARAAKKAASKAKPAPKAKAAKKATPSAKAGKKA